MIILTISQLILKKLLRLVTFFFTDIIICNYFKLRLELDFALMEPQVCLGGRDKNATGGQICQAEGGKFILWGGKQQTTEMIFTEGGCLASQPGQH